METLSLTIIKNSLSVDLQSRELPIELTSPHAYDVFTLVDSSSDVLVDAAGNTLIELILV